MSEAGTIARIGPAQLAEIRSGADEPYRRLWDLDIVQLLDLELYGNALGILMTEAGFPINPTSDGEVLPRRGKALALTVDEVRRLAEHLSAVPYEDLEIHLIAVTEVEGWFRVDPNRLADVDFHCRRVYRKLVDFYAAAAGRGQCTVYWTS